MDSSMKTIDKTSANFNSFRKKEIEGKGLGISLEKLKRSDSTSKMQNLQSQRNMSFKSISYKQPELRDQLPELIKRIRRKYTLLIFYRKLCCELK